MGSRGRNYVAEGLNKNEHGRLRKAIEVMITPDSVVFDS